jgi:hypothetical protein
MRSPVHTGNSRNIAFDAEQGKPLAYVRTAGLCLCQWTGNGPPPYPRYSTSSCVTRAARSPACTGPAKTRRRDAVPAPGRPHLAAPAAGGLPPAAGRGRDPPETAHRARRRRLPLGGSLFAAPLDAEPQETESLAHVHNTGLASESRSPSVASTWAICSRSACVSCSVPSVRTAKSSP